MTDDWLDETKKIFDLKEQRARIKAIGKGVTKGNIFRSTGINWKVLAVIALVITVIISFVAINPVVRNVMIILGIIAVVFLVINAIKGKVKFGMRGWLAIGIISFVGLAVLGTGLRLSFTLSLSDVEPQTHGWRFNMGGTMYYADKTQDTLNFYSTDINNPLLQPYNTEYHRTPIFLNCFPSTSQSWKMDMDDPRAGMPDIAFMTEGMYPSNEFGETINDFVFEDYPVSDNITLVQTFVKIVVTLEFTTDEPYMEVDHFILEDFFTRFDGEFYLEYITKGILTSDPKYTANTGGERVTGEFAFGIETGKIRWTADEVLPPAEFISTAVIGVDLSLQENSYARTAGVGGTLDGVTPQNWGSNGEYIVGHMGRQLLYRNTWDCLQRVDAFDSVPLSEKNLQDEWVPEVYVSIPFDVLMGGAYILSGSSDDLAEKDEVYWISRFTSKNTFIVEIVSAYDLNIGGGISPTVTNTGVDPDPDPNLLLDLWNQISGWVVDFWKSAWYGKVILIAVPVILVGAFGGVGISNKAKKKLERSRVGGAATQIVNVVIGEGNKIPDTIKKTTDRVGRKAKGFFGKLKRKLKFWK